MSGSVIQSPRWSQTVSAAIDHFGALLERIAFVCAVALPALYLPGLLADGFGPISSGIALALLAAHIPALVAGHNHRAP